MKAKDLIIEKWLNTKGDYKFNLADGKIKFIHVFQMLCPGCVYYGIPQTLEIYNKFSAKGIEVVGLHSVFEHHDVMTEAALQVFIKEWRLPFPVAIDKPGDGHWMPETMKAYHLQGTPSTIIIDGKGELKMCSFGHFDLNKLEAYLNELISNQADY